MGGGDIDELLHDRVVERAGEMLKQQIGAECSIVYNFAFGREPDEDAAYRIRNYTPDIVVLDKSGKWAAFGEVKVMVEKGKDEEQLLEFAGHALKTGIPFFYIVPRKSSYTGKDYLPKARELIKNNPELSEATGKNLLRLYEYTYETLQGDGIMFEGR